MPTNPRALAFLLTTFIGSGALACSLRDGPQSDSVLLEQSIAVVRARVKAVRMKEVPRSSCNAEVCSYAEVSFTVLERFKGRSPRSGMVKANQCQPCSFCFEVGQEYIFFVAPGESVDAFSSALLDKTGRKENEARVQWLREHAVK
jgi:hypothetical protein